jgi:hypothetical protein
MAQAVSRRPFTAEARFRSPVRPYGICGGRSAIGTGLSPSSSFVSCQYHFTVAVHIDYIYHLGPLVAAVQRHTLAPTEVIVIIFNNVTVYAIRPVWSLCLTPLLGAIYIDSSCRLIF